MSAQFQNQVLSNLGEDDLAALLPHLVAVTLRKGDVLTEQDGPVDEVYFPGTADLANVMMFADGRAVETSTVGSEGVSGLAAFLAGAPCSWRVVVQIEGTAWKLAADVLRRQIQASPALLARALELTHDYQSQAAQTAACNAIHEVAPRLARWLLLVQDRTDQSEILLTQGDIATLLGVQRTTINAAASELRSAGAIDYRRGRVHILDRTALRGVACSCYEAQRRRSQALGIVTRFQRVDRSSPS
ncbi:Crp/Fnr family transcriptional regulator [Brevundimonas goettingensis]|uniref:Crp/Fnr family transcriptional regulator n=1 Tax=Brevundimonas goettingensis TaxID=2774190 RepID=A0A975C2R5_9CAUL|nr:Crp/Fnr family transcriptional regulator [Brevundimonas goettingensis]QTC90261.1 Crp/Fnr family transcriptional regulator [Brevundimonas goettingensis]